MHYLRVWHSFCLISVEMQIKNLSPVINQQRHPMPMKAHSGGFSLIEILVVIGAIGIILGIAVPAYTGYREKANIAAAMRDLKSIETAIIELALDTGEWPGHQSIGEQNISGTNEIWNLNAATAGLVADDPDPSKEYPNWNGPYIPTVPKDPWGQDYFMDTDYPANGDGVIDDVVIGSLGPNGCCAVGTVAVNDGDNIVIILPLK